MELKKIGKYSILGKVGEGAMGHVYKAHDPVLDRHVAIKMIAHSRDANAEFRERFLREARSAARLNHPNIVTVYDFGEDQGRIYMAMELLEGMDLKDVIRGKPLRLEQKLRLMEQICAGLGFAHSKGIVHRDLKPGNIHVKASGQVKIMDFGLARLASSDMTKTGAVMGTPNYMSPEQVLAKTVDARSDVFSLGAVFYELLSNRKPFDADSMHAVMYKVVQCEREPLPEGLPRPVVGLVDRALSKDPGARFQDAGKLGEAVRTVRRDLDPTQETQVIEDPDVMATVVAERKSRARQAPRPRGEATPKAPPVGEAVGSGTERAGPRRGWRPVVVGGAVFALAAAVSVWLLRPGPPAGGAGKAGTVDALAKALVESQLQLAQVSLEGRDLRGALEHAEKVLAADPGQEEASSIRDEAARGLAQLDASLGEARARLTAGEPQEAARALAAALAIDPKHPAASELSRELNAYFQTEADEAKGRMTRSRQAAVTSGASAQAAFLRAERLAREGRAQMGRQDYALATQSFLSARDGYDEARRVQQRERALRKEAEQSRYEEAARAYREAAGSLRSAAAEAKRRERPREAERAAAPPPPPPFPTPSPTTSVSPAVDSRADDQAIRSVIAAWEQAIETKDVDLYRSVKPDLSRDDEQRLRASFEAVKSHDVEIRISTIDIEGRRATVRLTRRDTIHIDGRQQTKGIEQTLVFSKQATGWVIVDIS